MGILNVTPDSFSDGGQYGTLAAAIEAGAQMVDEGADIIDVGGESTRPGATPVPLDEELRRTVDVVNGLSQRGIRVSIDTRKAEVARQALAAGAAMVNDVTALTDPAMQAVCAEARCEVCLMHMQGDPTTMQTNPAYGDVVEEVLNSLLLSAETAQRAGIAPAKIWIDPGIGFGKTVEHNLTLLRHLGRFIETGYPVLLGVSRKGFIGKLLDGADIGNRLEGSLAIQTLAQAKGVQMVRVHDVAASVRAARVAAALL